MSTPTVFPSTSGRYVDFRQASPVVSLTGGAASWRGNSMAPLRTFPTLPGQTFAAVGSGRFGLIDKRVGPRVGGGCGTIDVWYRMGSGAGSVVILQSAYSTTSAPLITLGVNASGQAVGTFHNGSGGTVAAWAATALTSNPQGALVHMALAWNATTPINGLHHVTVVVNGIAMPVAGFSTAPLAAWPPFVPTYLATGAVTETGFDGEIFVTQASTRVSL